MAATLKNPHAVLAALQTRPQDVLELRWNPRTANEAWKLVAEQAGRQGVPVRIQLLERGRRDRSADGGRHSAAEATVRERPDVPLEQLFGQNPNSGLWLALDCLQDPHNVGAIFRTAAFFGVKGIVLTRDRSAPITATVYDVSSGGMEFVPFSQQTNLVRSIEAAKQAGLWVLGTSEHAPLDVAAVDRGRGWLLVVGNEEKGLRRLTLEHCDTVCRLTPRGELTSLNVSVATGILMATLTGVADASALHR